MKLQFKWIKWLNTFVVEVDDIPEIDDVKRRSLEFLIKVDIEAVTNQKALSNKEQTTSH